MSASESKLTPRGCPICSLPLPAGTVDCPNCHTPLTVDSSHWPVPKTTPFRPWAYHWPGLLGAFVSGLLSYMVIFLTGEMGSSLFFAVPIGFGALLGYHFRVGKVLGMLTLLCLVSGVVLAILMLNFAGMFCGITLGLIFLCPSAVGMCLGATLRTALKASNFSQRDYLPSLLIIAFPYSAALVEKAWPMPETIAVVETDLTLHSSAAVLWNSLMFYEEVRHEPPWLLKLALPKPIRAEGHMGEVGQVRRCIYDRGHLTKIITRRDEQRLLSFRVIEQSLHFEHDVELKDGSFALAPVSEEATRMTLTTRYRRLLRPAWLWQVMERKVVRTLHEHVLEGIRLDVLERTRPQVPHAPTWTSPNPETFAEEEVAPPKSASGG